MRTTINVIKGTHFVIADKYREYRLNGN